MDLKEAFKRSFPFQHGAWAVLIAGFFIGTMRKEPSLASACLLIASISGFSLRHSAGVILKDIINKNSLPPFKELIFPIMYTLILIFSLSILLIHYKLFHLITFGIVLVFLSSISLFLEIKRHHLTLPGEILNMFSLSLILPVSLYVSTGKLESRDIFIWLISLYLFVGSVFHVRYMVRKKKFLTSSLFERIKSASSSLIFHTSGLLFFIGINLKGGILISELIAVFLVFLRGILAVLIKWRGISLRQIGISELFLTIIFSFLLADIGKIVGFY